MKGFLFMKKILSLLMLCGLCCMASCTEAGNSTSSSPIDTTPAETEITMDQFKAAAANVPDRKESGVLVGHLTGTMTTDIDAASLGLTTGSVLTCTSNLDMLLNYNEISDEFILDEDNTKSTWSDPLFDSYADEYPLDLSVSFEELLTCNLVDVVDSFKEDDPTLEGTDFKFYSLKEGGFKIIANQVVDTDIEQDGTSYGTANVDIDATLIYDAKGFLVASQSNMTMTTTYDPIYSAYLKDSTNSSAYDITVEYSNQ